MNANQKIQTLVLDLKQSKEFCRSSRHSVNDAKTQLAKSGIYVIALYERKEKYLVKKLTNLCYFVQHITKQLQNIKKILNIRRIVQEKIRQGQFGEAIASCQECATLMQQYSKLESLRKLDINVRKTVKHNQ